MRVFAKCAYNGQGYYGWQAQKETLNTIQGQMEEALSTFLRRKVPIVGCGRTDIGVHASKYYFHFDTDQEDMAHLSFKLNTLLPPSIVIYEILPVHQDAHARYDAVVRGYTYHMTGSKAPFRQGMIYHYPKIKTLDIARMNQAAAMLLDFQDFTPFCKVGSEEKSKICNITNSVWTATTDGLRYDVESNRFLRGMIRLIVGMSINVGRGKLDLNEVRSALEEQRRLLLDWSVPADGLFLSKVTYPYILEH